MGSALSEHAIRSSVLSFRHLRNRKHRLCNKQQCQFSDKNYQPMSAQKFVPQFQMSEVGGCVEVRVDAVPTYSFCSQGTKRNQ